MKYEFNGISTEQFNEQDITEKFTEVCDGILIENEPFTVELDDKEIKVHLFIEDIDMADYEDCSDHIIEMGIVPAFESLTKENQESILNQFTPEDKASMLEDTFGLLYDCLCYGYRVILREETVKELDEVEHKIKSAVAVRHAVSGLIGFELDRFQNAIGNTGWDLLSDYCEGQDLIKLALSRVEK